MRLTAENRIAYENSIKGIVQSNGGKLDENWHYENCETKVKITCGRGHAWLITSIGLKQNHWCPECAGQIVHEEDIRKFVENKGGKLDKNWKYLNSKTDFSVFCAQGHEWKTNWDRLHKCWCRYLKYSQS